MAAPEREHVLCQRLAVHEEPALFVMALLAVEVLGAPPVPEESEVMDYVHPSQVPHVGPNPPKTNPKDNTHTSTVSQESVAP